MYSNSWITQCSNDETQKKTPLPFITAFSFLALQIAERIKQCIKLHFVDMFAQNARNNVCIKHLIVAHGKNATELACIL